MNELLFTPLSLSKLLKEKGVILIRTFYWKEKPKYSRNGKYELCLTEFELMTDIEKGFLAYGLSELPDVFRQVFGKKSVNIFEFFCRIYFSEPATAWETLEKTIRSL